MPDLNALRVTVVGVPFNRKKGEKSAKTLIMSLQTSYLQLQGQCQQHVRSQCLLLQQNQTFLEVLNGAFEALKKLTRKIYLKIVHILEVVEEFLLKGDNNLVH